MKADDVILAVLIFSFVLIGLSIFVGGVTSEYSDAVFDQSFNSSYTKMSALYNETNLLGSGLFTGESEEGDKESEQTETSIVKKATKVIWRLPSILRNTWEILFAKPSDTDTGGVIYTFAGQLGIPRPLLDIIVIIALVVIAFAVLRTIQFPSWLGGLR